MVFQHAHKKFKLLLNSRSDPQINGQLCKSVYVQNVQFNLQLYAYKFPPGFSPGFQYTCQIGIFEQPELM